MRFSRLPRRAYAGRGSRYGAWLAVLGLALAAAPLRAQTRFTWPDTAVDLSRYESVEECVAAVQRVTGDEARRARAVAWRDTLPWRTEESAERPPAPVVETARRCSAHFPPATARLEDLRFLLPMYLTADRDADAATYVARRLALLKPSLGTLGGARTADSAQARAEDARVAVVDSIVEIYLDAKPARIAPAESLMRALRRSVVRPMRVASMLALWNYYRRTMALAQGAADTARMRDGAANAIAIMDSLPASERPALEERVGNAEMLAAAGWEEEYVLAGRRQVMDSLRQSTGAYLRFQLALWTRANGAPPAVLDFPIGRQAPRLVDALRAPADSAAGPRPVPGKVNFVVFLDRSCVDVRPDFYRTGLDECLPALAILRRLAARFPALEVTTVDHAAGNFMYLPPPTPAGEARLMRESLAAHHAPGTLVMAETPFFRLPAPDRRRHDDRDRAPNDEGYRFGKTWSTSAGSAFLIDRDGTIVFASNLDRNFEGDWAEMIGILLGRQTAER